MACIGAPLEPGSKCHHCKRTMGPKRSRDQPGKLTPTRDHVEPQHAGGSDWVWACLHCNGVKGGMSWATWQAFMIAYPEWWRYGDSPKQIRWAFSGKTPPAKRLRGVKFVPIPTMTYQETVAFLRSRPSRRSPAGSLAAAIERGEPWAVAVDSTA